MCLVASHTIRQILNRMKGIAGSVRRKKQLRQVSERLGDEEKLLSQVCNKP